MNKNVLVKLAVFAVGIGIACFAFLMFITAPKPIPGVVPTSSPEVSAAVKVVIPVDLTGHWKTTDSSKIPMNAKISDNTIDIEMGNDSTRTAYWYGSLENPKTDGQTIVSNVLDNGKLHWSTATTKDFVFKDDKLIFEYKGMGITQTVELSRG